MDVTMFLFIFAMGFSTRMNLPVEAQVTEMFRRSSCKGDAMVLMCPQGSSITVLEAVYGYTLSTDHNCAEGSPPYCNVNLPTDIQLTCDHKENCTFIAESRHASYWLGCPYNLTNNLIVTYTCSGMTLTTKTTTVSSSSPATITVYPTYRFTSPVSATSAQKTTATETAKQGNPETALPFTSSITIIGAVIGGTIGAISLGLLIFNIAAICYIIRKKRSEEALPKSPDHSDQTHGNQDSSEGRENTYAQLGEQEPQQQYTELELQRRGTQFYEEKERQYVNQALAQSSDFSDQTHWNQADREGGENVYAQLGEQEPQHQYTELELQRRGTQFYEVNERQYVNQGFQMGVADSHGI